MNVGNATQGPNGKLATVNALNGAATPSGNNGTGGPAAVNVGNATQGPNGKFATVNALNGAATPSGNNGTGGPAAVNVGNATPGPNGRARDRQRAQRRGDTERQ